MPFKTLFISAGLLIISAAAGAQPRPHHRPVHHPACRAHHVHHVHHVAHRRPHHAPPHR